MSKKAVPFIVAIVLSCLVMAAAGVLSLGGAVKAEKFGSEPGWVQPFGGAESMKAIDLTGDGQEELFAQNTSGLAVYDANGEELWSRAYSSPKTTLGDVDGDGVEDIIVFYVGTGMSVDVISKGQVRTVAQSLNIGFPSRAALIRFEGSPEILLGDSSGELLAISLKGEPLWDAMAGYEELRGMDDARIGGKIHLAVASHDGTVTVFDDKGHIVWGTAQEQLRRMRTFDLNGDGNSEIITGGEYGLLRIYNTSDGAVLFEKTLGQAVSEVREVELNGEPASREFVVGGKDGGVWAYSFNGQTAAQMWSGSLSDKVTEISGLDIDEDGKQEAVIGAESGEVAIFTGDGIRHNLTPHSSGITRIDIGKFNGERRLVVADGSQVETAKINFNSLKGFEYTPIIVGVIVSAALVIIAAILASIPPKPQMKASFQDTSRESLEAERRMLKESIADVERLRKSGEVTGDAYLARLKQLRSDLAQNETAFKTAGFAIRVETFQCPRCGGTLELGMDKCEYCGQVILV